jgi:hypothetical protein
MTFSQLVSRKDCAERCYRGMKMSDGNKIAKICNIVEELFFDGMLPC